MVFALPGILFPGSRQAPKDSPPPQPAQTPPQGRAAAAPAPNSARRQARRRRSLSPLQWGVDRAAAVLEAPVAPDETTYRQLLQMGEARTFLSPTDRGLPVDPEDRRASLAAGERALSRAIAMRPAEPRPRLLLMRNHMLQGREAAVPAAALDTLRYCCADAPPSPAALQAALLGLKAVWRGGGGAAGAAAFVSDAAARSPELRSDLERLAARLEAQLSDSGCAADLLASPRWLSCADLQAVAGAHHSDAGVLLGGPERPPGDGSCPVLL